MTYSPDFSERMLREWLQHREPRDIEQHIIKEETSKPVKRFNFDWEHRQETTVYNEAGAGQSKIHRDWTLLPWNAMAEVIKVLETGRAKYGKDSWRQIPVPDHVAHMLEHAIAGHVCSDDTLLEIEHLSHVICRALFALDMLIEEVQDAQR